MPLSALAAVLLAACTHALWNFAAKSAAPSRHFVWFYSTLSCLVWAPVVLWVLWTTRPTYTYLHWLALSATAVLHLGYSLMLQAGYRASDLSLVYPLARGSGPLLSFFLAVLLLDEPLSWLSLTGVLLVVAGILLVSGLLQKQHRAPLRGIAYGLGTGCFIAAYTVNDGWAVKVLLISPVIIDYFGNFVRMVVLAPKAWAKRDEIGREFRLYYKPALVVAVLGPLGYMLVLYAMTLAPVSHVAPARELATLLGTFLGARLLQERAAPARIVGALCIVAGVISLTLTQ